MVRSLMDRDDEQVTAAEDAIARSLLLPTPQNRQVIVVQAT